MPSVVYAMCRSKPIFAECHYGECYYGECRGTLMIEYLFQKSF